MGTGQQIKKKCEQEGHNKKKLGKGGGTNKKDVQTDRQKKSKGGPN